MHARNPYREPPDFQALADAYPPLQQHIIATANGSSIDFKDEASQRRLTEAILHRDFGLTLELPPNRLCPPVPNRLNYILWLEDIVEASSLAIRPDDRVHPVRGLDIGTGASAIYPLLGCSLHPNWTFAGTDVDETSLEYARYNVRANGLQDRISVVRADKEGPMLLPMFQSHVNYDFVMCNPPFYSSREDVAQSAAAKELGPNAVCTGADVEMITDGGETAFVGRMVEESLALKDRCRWYTSMLGKMSSLKHIVQTLRDSKVDNYAVAELVQGQTRRWIIAWSFEDVRLPDSLARLSHPGLQNIMPARNTLKQRLPPTADDAQLPVTVSDIICSVEGLVVDHGAAEAPVLDLIVSASGDVWSRAARRKRQKEMQVEEVAAIEVRMTCRIRIEAGCLVFDWVKGRERGVFESFASHIERKVASAMTHDMH
ncbi:S-adenosyl-L-methionine dependent methyltransferase [Dichomitus squalens LYAD-421 SS1]|uniref:S-adenosyl-L-methionine dependent methyltransferase n=1 Tax=Dichomitus squalens (strain LYAD-421) TaxID=732165 RepID=R7SUJ5_DICSQ|nr:S-adenosyl-L-methionine dependent methyltransferase [Dichomitus squalens LYAD-421 SS1]EJF59706.1 S-adenosyl-L-methionine dependent methyltransferase [Dichomitus squalens LYAD-421 SS1]